MGLGALARQRPARAGLGALWLLLAPALVIVYLQYRQQFFALRYVLFALPIYLLLVTAVLVAASLVMDAYLKKGGSRRLEDF